MAEKTTGLLDQALGPIITTWQGLPPYAQIGAVGVAGALGLTFYWLQNRDSDDKLQATDWTEKWENMLKSPTEKVGAPDNTLLMNQSNSAAKRTVGVIKKVQETSTNIGGNELKRALNDKDKWEELKENNDLSTDAVTYSVVTGRKKLDRFFGLILYKLAGIFSKGSNPQAEYFDLPLNHIEVTDQGVTVTKDTHLFKKDGLWQTASNEGQQRLMQLSAMSTHQNWLESLQKHPEFYSDLNMNISGEKNIENTRSKNMREYKQAEKRQEKKEAMN